MFVKTANRFHRKTIYIEGALSNRISILAAKIMRAEYAMLSPRYSQYVRSLVAECFKRDPTKRPSVNAILRRPKMNNIALQYEPTLNLKPAPRYSSAKNVP